MLRVELLFDLPCKSVRAFTRELEYDYIQEGGLNDYVHMRRKPISKPFTLEVERYVGVDYVDPLPLGADLVLPVLLFVSRNHDQFIPGVVARTYVFTGVTVMKKTYGDLVADQSGLLVETTTLAYREMLCVDIPWSEVGDNISADTGTRPTTAQTADKSLEHLKAEGQDYYNRALEAHGQSQREFEETDADALLNALKDTMGRLKAATGDSGSLAGELSAAKEKLSEGGVPLAQRAKELELLADKADAERRKNEPAYLAKELSQEAYDASVAACEAARSNAVAARKKARDAAQRVSDAQARLEQAVSRIQPLQNCANQLPGRRDAAAVAQKACSATLPKCETANSALQAAGSTAAANPHYTEVKQTAKDILFNARQVRDTAQYMQTGRDLIAQATEFLIQQPEMGG